MIYFSVFILLLTSYEGAASDCIKTDIIIQGTGKSAVFFVDASYVLHHISFINTTEYEYKRMFDGSRGDYDQLVFDINFNGPIGSRMSVASGGNTFDKNNLTIELMNIGIFDNGTYDLMFDGYYAFCWTLFVLHTTSLHKGQLLPESQPGVYNGQPPFSLIKALALNVKCSWLLNGRYENQTTLFHVRGDFINIPEVSRVMEGWNVTYRCVENSGEIIDSNHTLNLMYINAPKYGFIEEGATVFFQGYPLKQTMEIKGFRFIWMYDGKDISRTSQHQFLEFEDKLLIPIVSRTMDGKKITYMVIENTGVVAETSCTLTVSYETSSPITLPIVMLAGVQAVSFACILCLFVLTLHNKKFRLFKRCQKSRCIERFCKSCTNKEKQTTPATSRSRSQDIAMSTLNNDAYEDLQSETRARQHETYDVVVGDVYLNT